MKKYVLTSQSFEGQVMFWFNEEGLMIFYHNESEMNKAQQEWLLANLPLTVDMIALVTAKIKGSLEQLPEDISFDTFWDLYAKKLNRIRAEKLYNKLNEGDKLKAINSIKHYDNYLQRNSWRSKADPDTYLRNQSYLTEWKNER